MTPLDRDLLIRTIASEAGNQGEQGMAAVAHVIKNRLATGKWGKTYGDVVFSRSQFEPWSRGGQSNDPFEIEANDPKYQAAARVVDGMLAGTVADPTKGATHFMNTATVRERNGGTLGKAGAWVKNQTAQIGAHTFYAPDGPAKAALAQKAIATAVKPEAPVLPVAEPPAPIVSSPERPQSTLELGQRPAAVPESPSVLGSLLMPSQEPTALPKPASDMQADMQAPVDPEVNTPQESANSYFSRLSPEQRGPNPLAALASLFGVSA